MRIAVHPADEGGCGYTRLIWPALALEASSDVDVRLVMPNSGDGLDFVASRRNGQTTAILTQEPDFDVLVCQRPMAHAWPSLIEALQRRGVRVVVDIDDDMSALVPQHATWAIVQPQNSPQHNREILAECCRRADLVTVSTPALAARYGAHGRVSVLRNAIPERYLSTRMPEGMPLVVGWPGVVATHPGDLDEMRGALTRARREHDFEWRVIGKGDGVQRATGVEPTVAPWVPIADYPTTLARLDVGVAPLRDHAFNRAKSWLKPLEFAACGVPWLGSDLPEYRLLADEGCGVIVEHSRNWSSALRRVLASSALRSELIEAGLEVAARHTIERNAWKWAEQWSDSQCLTK